MITTRRDGTVKGTEETQGLKHRKTTLLQKNHDKERLEDYSTSVACLGNRSRVVFMTMHILFVSIHKLFYVSKNHTHTVYEQLACNPFLHVRTGSYLS